MTEERAAAGADMELVRAAAEGDSGAFELLVRRYAGQVYRIALRVCGNPADAEDVAQEVFLKLCRSLNRFQGESSFHTFLYRVTTNAALDFLRGRKRRETVPLEAEGNGPLTVLPDPDAPPEEQLERRELQRAVRRGIAKLPAGQRTALALRELEGLSYAEIAAVLGLSEGTVKSRIARGRERLRVILEREGTFFPGRPSNEKEGGERG